MHADWAVYRQDFTGNEFLVARHLTEPDAERMAEEFESRKHHQHYYARRVPATKTDAVSLLRSNLSTGSPLLLALRVMRCQEITEQDCIRAICVVCRLDDAEARKIYAASRQPEFAT